MQCVVHICMIRNFLARTLENWEQFSADVHPNYGVINDNVIAIATDLSRGCHDILYFWGYIWAGVAGSESCRAVMTSCTVSRRTGMELSINRILLKYS